MVSPRGRRRGPDCAAAALWLAAILAAGGSVGAQAPARDPWPPGDGVHRSHIVVPPLTRKITIGVDKSMLLELPVDLQNVLVSNPEILDAVVQSSRRVYRLAKDVGDANAFFLGADGQMLVFLEVTVARDLTALSDALARLIPGSQIKAESVGDNVVLTGSVITPIDANRAAELAGRYTKKRDAVANMLAVGTKEQALLRVQVAEMQRDAIRRIGVNLPEAILKGNNITFTKVMQNALPVTSQSVIGAVSGGAGSVPFVVGGEAAQPTWTNGANAITAFIQALERAGLVRTLAEPNLTAISGEKAEFQAGGEFPVPVSSEDRQVSVSWKNFGVSLSFTPVVLSQGRISLNVSAEVSELTSDGAVTLNDIAFPALKVRTRQNHAGIAERRHPGAMAGLISDATRQSLEGVPGIKNIPVLGVLFRSNDYQRKESERVMLVTPYLATHAAKADFARPDNRIYGVPGHLPRGRYEGDYGFIVESPDAGVKG